MLRWVNTSHTCRISCIWYSFPAVVAIHSSPYTQFVYETMPRTSEREREREWNALACSRISTSILWCHRRRILGMNRIDEVHRRVDAVLRAGDQDLAVGCALFSVKNPYRSLGRLPASCKSSRAGLIEVAWEGLRNLEPWHTDPC